MSMLCMIHETATKPKKTDSTYYFIYFLSIEEKQVMTFKHDNFMNFINPKQN